MTDTTTRGRAATDRARHLPPLPETQAADRYACLTDLLRDLGRIAALDAPTAITTHLAATHCSLHVEMKIHTAYNTEEAIDVLRTFTTMLDVPSGLRLCAPRMLGNRAYRTLEAAGHHGGTGLHDALLTVRLTALIETTSSETAKTLAGARERQAKAEAAALAAIAERNAAQR